MKHYGFLHMMFDFIMTILTCGLWIILVAVRYLRTH